MKTISQTTVDGADFGRQRGGLSTASALQVISSSVADVLVLHSSGVFKHLRIIFIIIITMDVTGQIAVVARTATTETVLVNKQNETFTQVGFVPRSNSESRAALVTFDMESVLKKYCFLSDLFCFGCRKSCFFPLGLSDHFICSTLSWTMLMRRPFF